MSEKLTVKGNEVSGEIALQLAPGMKAGQIDQLLFDALNEALHEAATELGAVLGTYPARYAKPLPGRDAEGKIRYAVRARREGDRLVPAHNKG